MIIKIFTQTQMQQNIMQITHMQATKQIMKVRNGGIRTQMTPFILKSKLEK